MKIHKNPIRPNHIQWNPLRTHLNPFHPIPIQLEPFSSFLTRFNPVHPTVTLLEPVSTRSNPVQPDPTRSNPRKVARKKKPGQSQRPAALAGVQQRRFWPHRRFPLASPRAPPRRWPRPSDGRDAGRPTKVAGCVQTYHRKILGPPPPNFIHFASPLAASAFRPTEF